MHPRSTTGHEEARKRVTLVFAQSSRNVRTTPENRRAVRGECGCTELASMRCALQPRDAGGGGRRRRSQRHARARQYSAQQTFRPTQCVSVVREWHPSLVRPLVNHGRSAGAYQCTDDDSLAEAITSRAGSAERDHLRYKIGLPHEAWVVE